jgi:putative membrane protein
MQSSIVIVQQLIILIGSPYNISILLYVNLKIMFYDGYHLAGMHLFWWFVWFAFIFWLFVTSFNIMGYIIINYSVTHDFLKKRLDAGEISNEEYHEKKKIIASK